MKTIGRTLLLDAYKMMDLLSLGLAFLLGAWISFRGLDLNSFEQFLAMRLTVANTLVMLAMLIAWHLSMTASGLYRPRRFSTSREELRDVLRGTTAGTIMVLAFAILFRVDLVTMTFLAVFWMASSAIVLSHRLAIRSLLRLVRRRGRNLRHVLVVGTGTRATRLARRFEAEPELGYRLIGFVDDEWPGIGEARAIHPVAGTLQDVPRLLRDMVIDDVVICLPMRSFYRQAARIVELCEEQGIPVRVQSDLFATRLARPDLPMWDDESLVTLYPGAMNGVQAIFKRLLDVAVSLTVLLAVSPVLLLVAALIRLDSPGPVFFLQQRRGLNKRPFTMFKFRTMRRDAEQMLLEVASLNEEQGPAFKIRNDPRITRVGRYLRRMSIDELPQLLNVLRGEMSLVGPRPLFAWEFDRIDEPWVKRRCSVKPGLTGLWQVSGRSDLPFDKRIELDLQYIDNWSLDLDLRILARTIPAVVQGRGAA